MKFRAFFIVVLLLLGSLPQVSGPRVGLNLIGEPATYKEDVAASPVTLYVAGVSGVASKKITVAENSGCAGTGSFGNSLATALLSPPSCLYFYGVQRSQEESWQVAVVRLDVDQEVVVTPARPVATVSEDRWQQASEPAVAVVPSVAQSARLAENQRLIAQERHISAQTVVKLTAGVDLSVLAMWRC